MLFCSWWYAAAWRSGRRRHGAANQVVFCASRSATWPDVVRGSQVRVVRHMHIRRWVASLWGGRTRLIHRLFLFFRSLALSLVLCRTFAFFFLAFALSFSLSLSLSLPSFSFPFLSFPFLFPFPFSLFPFPSSLFLLPFSLFPLFGSIHFHSGIIESWSLSCEQLCLVVVVLMEVRG